MYLLCLCLWLGCDRGFGHALAIRLDQLGFRVFAGCLDKTGDGAVKLEAQCSDKLKTIQLDITKDDDVEMAAQTVKAHLGRTGNYWESLVRHPNLALYNDMVSIL